MHRIGWIKPDDGERRDGKLLSYECFGVEKWLAERGICDCAVEIELLRAEPFHTPEDLTATGAVDRLAPCADRLASRNVEVIAWVCTSGSFAGGREWAEEQRNALRERTGTPVVTTSLAIADALAECRLPQVDIISPYPQPLTGCLVDFLKEYGISIGHLATLDCLTGGESHRLDVAAVLKEFIRDPRARSGAILLPDTAINTLDRGLELERIAHRPVLTANQISLWSILRSIGIDPAISGAGSLLSGGLKKQR